MKRSFRTNSRRNATIFGTKWYQILAKSKAKEGDWTVLRKTDFLAVLPTGYGKSLIHQLLIRFLADGLNIFPQALATDLPYLTFSFTWQTLQTSLQMLSFWTAFLTGFFSLFPTSNGLQILNLFSKTTKTRNTRTYWRLQILSRKKWRDSDWIILTARHSTVEWVCIVN